MDAQYIYLLQEREFRKSNENVYKIGKTKQEHLKRFNQYPTNSKLLLQIECIDCNSIEIILIKMFKNKYIQRTDVGREYFEGCHKDMINNIYHTILNPVVDINNASSSDSESESEFNSKSVPESCVIPKCESLVIPDINIYKNLNNMFNCNCCNYNTDRKSNYNLHLKTSKHLKKLKIGPSLVHHLSITCPSIYDCKSCNKSFSTQSSLSKHHKKCMFSKISELQVKLENQEKDNQEKENQLKLIKETNDKLIKKVKECYEQEINELKESNKELNNQLHSVKDKQINILQNNLKPYNNNNTQIIINNYPNAPNIGFPDNIQVDESLKEYIQLGGVKGLGKFISDYWAKDINPVNRSIWMVDIARNKFLLRCKNAWFVDIDGKQFQELNIQKIQNIFNDYLQKYDFDTYDYLKTIEFILDIKTKNMIVKGLKDAGKYLVYDKEKFSDFEIIQEKNKK